MPATNKPSIKVRLIHTQGLLDLLSVIVFFSLVVAINGKWAVARMVFQVSGDLRGRYFTWIKVV
jgi:hypothetical protein